MKLSALIVFYNAKPTESATLQSILKADLTPLQGMHLVLWNNGPSLFDAKEVEHLQEILTHTNISATLYNTTHNCSLSAIYNFFIKQGSQTHYIIFDHDSLLPTNFFSNLATRSNYNIVLPVLIETLTKEEIGPASRDKAHAPFYFLTGEKEYKGRPVISITSGLCFSANFAKDFCSHYSSVFNEAFSLYAVDSCFFDYLSEFLLSHPNYPFYVTNTMTHSLSKYLDEGLPMQKFKEVESAYANTLLRLHTKKKSRRAAVSYIFRKCLPHCSSLTDFLSLLKCVITKRHPRVTVEQKKRFTEVTQQPTFLSSATRIHS